MGNPRIVRRSSWIFLQIFPWFSSHPFPAFQRTRLAEPRFVILAEMSCFHARNYDKPYRFIMIHIDQYRYTLEFMEFLGILFLG